VRRDLSQASQHTLQTEIGCDSEDRFVQRINFWACASQGDTCHVDLLTFITSHSYLNEYIVDWSGRGTLL
jgi:hypothetical protein